MRASASRRSLWLSWWTLTMASLPSPTRTTCSTGVHPIVLVKIPQPSVERLWSVHVCKRTSGLMAWHSLCRAHTAHRTHLTIVEKHALLQHARALLDYRWGYNVERSASPLYPRQLWNWQQSSAMTCLEAWRDSLMSAAAVHFRNTLHDLIPRLPTRQREELLERTRGNWHLCVMSVVALPLLQDGNHHGYTEHSIWGPIILANTRLPRKLPLFAADHQVHHTLLPPECWCARQHLPRHPAGQVVRCLWRARHTCLSPFPPRRAQQRKPPQCPRRLTLGQGRHRVSKTCFEKACRGQRSERKP